MPKQYSVFFHQVGLRAGCKRTAERRRGHFIHEETEREVLLRNPDPDGQGIREL